MGYSIRHGSTMISGLTAQEALISARGLIAEGAITVSIYDPDGDPMSLRALDRTVHSVDLLAAAYGKCRPAALSWR